MELSLDHVEGEFERRDLDGAPLDDHAPGEQLSASPHCPPLELELDRLSLSGAIAQQNHHRGCKPQ